MEIRPVVNNAQSNMPAFGVMRSMILRQIEAIEAFQWPSNAELDWPRQGPSADPTPLARRETGSFLRETSWFRGFVNICLTRLT